MWWMVGNGALIGFKFHIVGSGNHSILCIWCLNYQDIHHKINAVYGEHAIYHPENCTSVTDKLREGRNFKLHHSNFLRKGTVIKQLISDIQCIKIHFTINVCAFIVFNIKKLYSASYRSFLQWILLMHHYEHRNSTNKYTSFQQQISKLASNVFFILEFTFISIYRQLTLNASYLLNILCIT